MATTTRLKQGALTAARGSIGEAFDREGERWHTRWQLGLGFELIDFESRAWGGAVFVDRVWC
jgi:hypothetical protein